MSEGSYLGHYISRPRYIPLTAWLRHGPFAMWLVGAARPKKIVELGSHYGYSYFAFCQAVKETGLSCSCVAVDTWKGDEHAGQYGDEVYQSVLDENACYKDFSTLLRKTFAEALDDVEDGSVDLLHVDGRHFYDDVKEDFESWMPKLSENAIVLFHDTVVHERGFGVWRYWKELKDAYPTFNFTYQHGLGVLFWGDVLTPEMAEFRTAVADVEGAAEVHNIFASQGEALADMQAGAALCAEALNDPRFMALKTAALTTLSRLNETNQELARTNEFLHEVRRELERACAELDETKIKQVIKDLEVAESHHALELERAQNQLFREHLFMARSRPWKIWRDKARYVALSLLVSGRLPLSEQARARIVRSAEKRNPARSLEGAHVVGVSPLVPGPPSALSNQVHLPRLEGRLPRHADRVDVLVVTHESTATGAPILAYNIARVLSDRYNVTLLSLRDGPISDSLRDVACEVIVTPGPPQPGSPAWQALKQALTESPMQFAIANSLESRYVLPLFFEMDIPSLALIHEFASFFPAPEGAFDMVMKHADHVVFSSSLTFDDAAESASVEMASKIHILPQGKCLVPRKDSADLDTHDSDERNILKSQLRPTGEEHSFLVIGAGYVQGRKGVDLFIEVARLAISRAEVDGRKLRFAWIGDGFDEKTSDDLALVRALKDQLRRAAMSEDVIFVPLTTQIEYVYELADVLLLSSRLDPLPNVAIDAMSLGLPVISFEHATGISCILRDAGLGDTCVADYLDTADMGDKLLALMQSPGLYKMVSETIQAYATSMFDMVRYVGTLEAMALATQQRNTGREADIERISSEEHFEPAYVLGPNVDNTDRKATARIYLEQMSRASVARRPEPGFNPHRFAQHLINGSGAPLDIDPYAEFLRQGRPQGPWIHRVIRNTDDAALTDLAQELRTALHIHAYYVEELPKILDRITHNMTRPALFISVVSQKAQVVAKKLLKRYEGDVCVEVIPNIGRDIAPLLTGFGQELVREFDIVGHVHTKKSLFLGQNDIVQIWTDFLFENVLGGLKGGAMIDRTMSVMAEAPDIGIVFPGDPNLIACSRNIKTLRKLAARLEIETLPTVFDFPIGTMFWMRAEALKPFVDLNLGWNEYPREPIANDNTILHAMERMFGIHPVLHGYRAAVQNVVGLSR